jgi:hypothetical protein
MTSMAVPNCPRPWRAAAKAAALVTALASGLAAPMPALAQDTGVFRADSDLALLPSIIASGTLNDVRIVGLEAGSAEARTVLETLGAVQGQPPNWLALQQGLAAVRKLPGVAGARFVIERTTSPVQTVLVLTIEPAAPEKPKLASSDLLKSDRAQVSLILNAAIGGYSDTRPWFGDPQTFNQFSPIATGLPTGRRASWVETSVEAGAGAITQVGSSPFYLYGAATAMFTAAAGQDLFTDEARALLRMEKLYGGIIFGEAGSRRAVNISAGRQNFNLSDGFLFSQFAGSSNAGPRPGLFLNPRIAFDNAVLVDVLFDKARLKAFYLDPDELEDFESNTHFAGLNATYNFTPQSRLGITYALIPRSDVRFGLPDGRNVRREGIETLAFEGRLDSPVGLNGVWLQSEYARQWRASEMRAWAAYGTVGWRSTAGWQPGLSYRFSAFSGDDPTTTRYERYDPMLSNGLGEWVQGINFKKLLDSANVNVHRIRFTAKPTAALNLTLDLFDFKARELNNLGGNPALSVLASRNLGREVTLRGDWFLSRRLYLLLVASHAVPGDAIRLATPTGGRAWTTVQASLFWHL